MGDFSKTNESPKTNDDKYRELISTLPRKYGWRISEHLYKHQGFWYPSVLLPAIISAQDHFIPQPNHVILSSFPKCGTTWLKALAFAIVTRKSFDDSTNPLFTKLPHEIVPCLELVPDHKSNDYRDDPKIFPLCATHIPYTFLPKSIVESDCKVIYISRDCKDAFISLWHFVNKGPTSPIGDEQEGPFPLEEAFKLFHEGASLYGPYWDHALGYWKASLEYPKKVLFVKYEDLKNDPLSHVKRMANFLGHPFSLQEEREGVVEKIVSSCSFEKMSNIESNKSGKYELGVIPPLEKSAFFRKGETGDWKNYLTDEMAAQLDQITKEKFNGSGLVYGP